MNQLNRIHRLLLVCCAVAALMPVIVHAQSGRADAIRTLAALFMRDSTHVGLSIGVFDSGHTETYFYGTINKKTKAKADEHTLYEIGSITKSFTGILLGQAVVDGKLNLNDPVSKYLGEGYENLAYNNKPVTIIHLANHTAGFPKNVPDYPGTYTADEIFKVYRDYSEAQFLTDLKEVKLTAEPGAVFRYSNAGTQLLAIILEKLYHADYAALIRKYVTGPAGMSHTATVVNVNDIAQGYDAAGNAMPLLEQWKTIPAAGYLKSNIHDMLRYIAFNINDRNRMAVNLAHTATFRHTDEDGADIGFYWFIKNTTDGERAIMHAGGSFGTTSFCLIEPGLQRGIICIANDAAPGTERALRKLAGEIILME
ncbi:serine hydrolase domain-containing protein [Deminuibacter soli]|uniref:Class A beta-lactamase-related serine hydrolase n=1 Tax=Deminuibacter soli TaxID=2291815 RepID=A0A3E1NI96_9BACT|nr:serine hydrolase domain-containing protein [Deminuibacter soli]RFM27650.1 class A beta-lactamase-related serine hydrolase [Deminuibacter soli]